MLFGFEKAVSFVYNRFLPLLYIITTLFTHITLAHSSRTVTRDQENAQQVASKVIVNVLQVSLTTKSA